MLVWRPDLTDGSKKTIVVLEHQSRSPALGMFGDNDNNKENSRK